MKKILNTLFLVGVIFCLPTYVLASHTGGGEVTYKCTATPGVMEVTLVYYRDCGSGGVEMCTGGCGAACTRTMYLKGVDPAWQSTSFTSFVVTLQNVRDVNANELCPGVKNMCANMGCVTPGTYTPAFERYEFKGTVNIGPASGIPASACNLRFVFEECCRSSSISTGGANQNLYLDAVINRCQALSPCNSSPIFLNDPGIIINGGENFLFNNGAVDPDRDSLTFSFAPGLQGFNSPISYVGPFAYDKPMPWSGPATGIFPAGIHCDSANGDIMFTPGNAGSSNFMGVVTIEVKQWKTVNGVPTVIGITRRDMLAVVLANSAINNPPRFKTIPWAGTNQNVPQTNWNALVGQQLCFTVIAKDTDYREDTIVGNPPLLSDTTFLRMDSTMIKLGATFLPTYTNRSVDGPREDSYQFCWTPDTGHMSTLPYYFTISAKDSRCPMAGKLTRSFAIKVRNENSFAYTTSKQDMGCGNWKIGYSQPAGSEAFGTTKLYVSKVANDTTFAFGVDSFENIPTFKVVYRPVVGKYLIKMVAGWGASTQIQYDTLTVNSAAVVVNTPDSLIMCSPSTATISATAQYGVAPYQYRWFYTIKDTSTFPLNASPYTSSSYTTPVLSENQNLVVQVRDSKGCRTYDSTRIVLPMVVKSLSVQRVSCFGLSDGKITLQMKDTLFPYQYKLGSGAFQSGKVFSGLPAGTHIISIKDSGTCGIIDYPIAVPQPDVLRETFVNAVQEKCFNTKDAYFSVSAMGGTYPYYYSIDSLQYFEIGSFTNLVPGKYTIHIKDSSGCSTSVTRTIEPTDSLTIVPIVTPSCLSVETGKILLRVTGGTKPYRFKFGTNGYVLDSVYRNLPAGKYGYTVKDAGTCLKSDSVVVTAMLVTASAITGSTMVNVGDTQTYSVTPQAGVSYTWSAQQGIIVGGVGYTPTIKVKWTGFGSGEVQVVMYTNLACADTSTLAVSIGNTGVQESTMSSSGISMYPNPVTHTLFVEIDKIAEGNRVQLFDITGKLVYDQPATTQQSIEMEELRSGVYLLRIGNWQQKVVKE